LGIPIVLGIPIMLHEAACDAVLKAASSILHLCRERVAFLSFQGVDGNGQW